MSRLRTVEPGKPAVIPVSHKKGDTFQYEIKGYNKDGTAYDFTGHTFLMQVKESKTDALADALVAIDDDEVTITQDADGVTAGVNNLIQISIPASELDIAAGIYFYDLQMTDAAAVVQTIQEGEFEITQDVSRAT